MRWWFLFFGRGRGWICGGFRVGGMWRDFCCCSPSGGRGGRVASVWYMRGLGGRGPRFWRWEKPLGAIGKWDRVGSMIFWGLEAHGSGGLRGKWRNKRGDFGGLGRNIRGRKAIRWCAVATSRGGRDRSSFGIFTLISVFIFGFKYFFLSMQGELLWMHSWSWDWYLWNRASFIGILFI